MDHNFVYDLTAVQMSRGLSQLKSLLDKAEKHTKTKNLESPEAFLEQRLIIDQFPLGKQIQITCDIAKFTCSRLTGKEAPKHPDTERTFGELRARIDHVMTYLKTFSANDFKPAIDQKIRQAWKEGFFLTGHDYLQQLALPNFYFHLTTAYTILRSHGVEVGKADYLGELNWHAL